MFVRSSVIKAVSRGLTNHGTLNQLVSAGVDNVRLDKNLDASDLVALGRQFASFDADELVGYSIPSESGRSSGGPSIERPLKTEAEPILTIFRGLPPGTTPPQSVREIGKASSREREGKNE